MDLKGFLSQSNTDSNVTELILFFSKMAGTIRNGFLGGQGKAGTKNIFGEEQMALDTWADEVLITELKKKRLVRWIATEEQPGIIEVEHSRNEFGVVIDPLDGSSLIDVNLAVGTIIGIYPGDVLQPGNTLIAAMYILYGPLTTLTFTAGKGVHDFVMDTRGVFNLRASNIRIPEGKIYAPGALRKDYLPQHARFIEHLEKEGYKLRFSGSFVADMHQILHKGGYSRTRDIKEKRKESCACCLKQTPWAGSCARPAAASATGEQISCRSSLKPSMSAHPSMPAGERKLILSNGSWPNEAERNQRLFIFLLRFISEVS